MSLSSGSSAGSQLETLLTRFREIRPVVLPSMLLCDFGNLQKEIERLEEAGVESLHMDVMDGEFVPNMTYGMPIVEAVSKLTNMPIDVHLMIRDPNDTPKPSSTPART